MLFQVNSKQAVLLPHWYTVPVPLCHHVHHNPPRAWHAHDLRPEGENNHSDWDILVALRLFDSQVGGQLSHLQTLCSMVLRIFGPCRQHFD